MVLNMNQNKNSNTLSPLYRIRLLILLSLMIYSIVHRPFILLGKYRFYRLRMIHRQRMTLLLFDKY